jgi:hypothetical protein
MPAGVGPPGVATPVEVSATRIALCTALRAVLRPPNVESGGLCVIVTFEPLAQPARTIEPKNIETEAAAVATRRVE